MTNSTRLDPWVILMCLLIATPLLAGFCFMLLYSVGLIGLLSPGFTTHYWSHVLTNHNTWLSLGYSALVGGASLGASLLLALGLQAALGARIRRGVLHALLFVPLTLAPLVAALLSVEIFGNTGLLARLARVVGLIERPEQFPSILYSLSGVGVVVTHMMLVTPFFVLLLDRVARHESVTALTDVAGALGASGFQCWRRVSLPLMLRASAPVLSIYLVVLMGAYEVPLMVGTQYPAMISVSIARRFSQFDLRLRPEAYALACLYAVVATGLLLFFAARQRRAASRHGA